MLHVYTLYMCRRYIYMESVCTYIYIHIYTSEFIYNTHTCVFNIVNAGVLGGWSLVVQFEGESLVCSGCMLVALLTDVVD